MSKLNCLKCLMAISIGFIAFLNNYSNLFGEDLRDKIKAYYAEPENNFPISDKEKYVSKPLFSINFTQDCSEEKYPDCPIYQFDVHDNLYLLCGSFVRVFDKAGKLIKEINWGRPRDFAGDNVGNFRILVDEIGNIIVYGKGQLHAMSHDTDSIQTAYMDWTLWDGYYAMSNGVLYSWKDGQVLFVMKGYDPKGIRQKIFENYFVPEINGLPIHGIQLKINGSTKTAPRKFDQYRFKTIVGIDDAGNAYARYVTPYEVETYDDNTEADFHGTRIYKFDKNLDLLSYFKVDDLKLNPETGEVFTKKIESINGKEILSFSKWTPIK